MDRYEITFNFKGRKNAKTIVYGSCFKDVIALMQSNYGSCEIIRVEITHDEEYEPLPF